MLIFFNLFCIYVNLIIHTNFNTFASRGVVAIHLTRHDFGVNLKVSTAQNSYLPKNLLPKIFGKMFLVIALVSKRRSVFNCFWLISQNNHPNLDRNDWKNSLEKVVKKVFYLLLLKDLNCMKRNKKQAFESIRWRHGDFHINHKIQKQLFRRYSKK